MTARKNNNGVSEIELPVTRPAAETERTISYLMCVQIMQQFGRKVEKTIDYPYRYKHRECNASEKCL